MIGGGGMPPPYKWRCWRTHKPHPPPPLRLQRGGEKDGAFGLKMSSPTESQVPLFGINNIHNIVYPFTTMSERDFVAHQAGQQFNTGFHIVNVHCFAGGVDVAAGNRDTAAQHTGTRSLNGG